MPERLLEELLPLRLELFTELLLLLFERLPTSAPARLPELLPEETLPLRLEALPLRLAEPEPAALRLFALTLTLLFPSFKLAPLARPLMELP